MDYQPVPLVQTSTTAANSVFKPVPVDLSGLPSVTALLVALPGYDAGEIQTLTNDTGVLKWVTVTP